MARTSSGPSQRLARKSGAGMGARQPLNDEELACLKSHLQSWSSAPRRERPAMFSKIYHEAKSQGPRLDGKEWKKRKEVSFFPSQVIF